MASVEPAPEALNEFGARPRRLHRPTRRPVGITVLIDDAEPPVTTVEKLRRVARILSLTLTLNLVGRASPLRHEPRYEATVLYQAKDRFHPSTNMQAA